MASCMWQDKDISLYTFNKLTKDAFFTHNAQLHGNVHSKDTREATLSTNSSEETTISQFYFILPYTSVNNFQISQSDSIL